MNWKEFFIQLLVGDAVKAIATAHVNLNAHATANNLPVVTPDLLKTQAAQINKARQEAIDQL